MLGLVNLHQAIVSFLNELSVGTLRLINRSCQASELLHQKCPRHWVSLPYIRNVLELKTQEEHGEATTGG
jgi:hypothetical protein